MHALAGIGGTLFPGRFLVDRLAAEAARLDADPATERARRHLRAWWTGAESECGPATGIRRLFDRVATPLFGALGFSASDLSVQPDRALAKLSAPAGAHVVLLLLPWASHPSAVWREPVVAARASGADWAFIVAPPFVSLLDTRGHAMRRSLDLRLPEVLDRAAFPVFWTLARASAFDRRAPGVAPIDAWIAAAATYQDRVRVDLQSGVVEALRGLDAAASRSPLTVVFRILFLLFAESRRLVPVGHPIYANAYTVSGLCHEAQRPGRAAGLADSLAAITRLSRSGCRTGDLIVTPFNGALFARSAAPDLEARGRTGRLRRDADRRDNAIGQALIALGTRPGRGGRESIAYADLGVEQLGAVYERILDLEPGDLTPAALARPGPSHSARRKATGTFYTPQSLAEFVVRRTLAPLVAGARADAILALRVVDPAMGSGAFLVAACRYLAVAYERALVEEGRVSAADLDDSRRAELRRLVAERCLAGVDRNPVAVQLARLSLWLATLAQGRPLSFLDHRLRVGDSLLGASPDELLRAGRARPTAPLPLFDAAGLEQSMQRIARPLGDLALTRDDTVAEARAKQALWIRLTSERSALGTWRRAADTWCARWFLRDVAPPSGPELRALLDAILRADRALPAGPLRRWLDASRRAAEACAFFHWPLEFADVFYDRDGRPRPQAGFDAVIGNPPWEMLRREPPASAVAGARVSATRPPAALRADVRGPGILRFIRESGLYPHCATGHLNLYQPFLERSLALARPGGRVGVVLPWGFASDDGAAELRRLMFTTSSVDTLVGFDNARGLFPIHRGIRFLVMTTRAGGPADGSAPEIRARFGVRSVEEIDTLPSRDDGLGAAAAYPVRLTADRLAAISGPALRIPDARRSVDLRLIERLCASFPPLGAAEGWAARFGRELNATEDRGAFTPAGLPVIEGKHIAPFAVDTRVPAAWIPRGAAARLLPSRPFERARLAYRDVSGVANRVTLIAAVLPAGVVTTHTLFCLRTPLADERQHFLCALLNSFVLNLVARMLMGSHLTTSLVEQLPAPRWTDTPADRRIARLAARLAGRLAARPAPRLPTRPAMARDFDARADRLLEARLQAEVARLYALDAPAFAALLDAFPLIPAADRELARRLFDRLDARR